MDSKPKYAMQVSGINHLWRNPGDTFRHTFLKLDFDCEPDRYPGIVIVTEEHYQHTFATVVQNLQRELPALLEHIQEKTIVYWWFERNQNETKRILSGLTDHPVFADKK